MSFEMPKCKITVLKRTINQDLIDEYLDDEYKGIGLCDSFKDGQESVIEDYSVVPDGFCASAWADIRKNIVTTQVQSSGVHGSSLPWCDVTCTLNGSSEHYVQGFYEKDC